MKKLGIALMLALALMLTPGSVALADDPIELQEADGATAEWTDEEAAVGDYSVELNWPAPYWEDGDYIVPRASVAITDLPDNLTIGAVDDWSYWANAPEDYAPNLTFYTDTVGDNDSDTTITAWPTDAPGDTWTLIDEATIGGYQGVYVVWGSNPWPSWVFDWSAVQDSYGSAEIIDILIGKGVIGTNMDITVYVDDFTINGIVYVFEPPPPEPPPPEPPSPPASFSDPSAGFAGQFLVVMCGWGSHAGYNWVEGPKGKTLAKLVSQICHYCFNGFSAYYKLEILEGTVVEGYYAGLRVQELEFKIIGGEYYFSPASVKFSKPVTLYQGIDGEWVEVLEFTQVLNGKAS